MYRCGSGRGFVVLLCLVPGVLGGACAKGGRMAAAPEMSADREMKKEVAAASAPRARAPTSAVEGEAQASPAPGGAPADRRILVKTGSVSLVVQEAKKAEAEIDGLLKGFGGFVAGRESFAEIPQREVLSPSEVSSIRLTLKVPAARFDEFVAEIKKVGSYTREQVSIEDVTFRYVDLEARLGNQKKVEERLLSHLEKAAEMKDTIEVERELARVREQIESMTAEFKVLQDQVAFSTLSLEVSVRPDWTPPSERTFWQDLRETLGESLGALGNAARLVVVYFVAVLPWCVVLGAVALIAWVVMRVQRRKRQ